MTGLEYIQKLALDNRDDAVHVIGNISAMSSLSQAAVRQTLFNILSRGRVALHFHPDRLVRGNLSVIESLSRDGFYRNQFETHISNGLLSPEIGGQRDHWELAYFNQPSLALSQRPKYGALDFGLHANGPAPRFGSAYLLSKPRLMKRCSFCYPDSYRQPRDRATAHCFEPIFAALLSECFERDYVLGVSHLRPPALIALLNDSLALPLESRDTRPVSHNLDHYVEAQVHGEVSISEDMDALVVDASFRDSTWQPVLSAFCQQYDLQLIWSPALRLAVDQVPRDYRGSLMPTLARLVSAQDCLTAVDIGRAAADFACGKHPSGLKLSPLELAQQLKLLWHVLLRFGQPT